MMMYIFWTLVKVRYITSQGKQKRADYLLFYKPNLPLAIIEAVSGIQALKSPKSDSGSSSVFGGKRNGTNVLFLLH